MPEPFAYDAVDYPSAAVRTADPGHLYAVARMYGADPAPPDRCRYLEVGCGDGTHLLACALTMPAAAFVGVDLSAAAVDRGNRLIAEVGLSNVTLHAADVTAWEPPAGGFDYAAAHGVYSWVPPPVRDGLLGLFGRCLRPHGVGYVSYNALPGCHTRRVLWDVLKRHTAAIPTPAAKIAEARELLKFLFAGLPPEGTGGPGLEHYRHELGELLHNRHPAVIYHDDLSDVNDPVYVADFAAHAARFGLRYVADAEPQTMEWRALPPDVARVLGELAGRDVVEKEQYLDYLRLRRFRRTLLSPDGRAPQPHPDPARVAGLAVSGFPQPPDGPVDLSPGAAVAFTGELGTRVRTDLPVAKAALLALAGRWPVRVPFPELVRAAGEVLGAEPSADDAAALAGFLTRAWSGGLVELNGHAPPAPPARPSDRPAASPLARAQVRAGDMLTTPLLHTMKFEDPAVRRLIGLLDGTRDRDVLAAELAAGVPADGRPDPAAVRDSLDRVLARLARAGVLVG